MFRTLRVADWVYMIVQPTVGTPEEKSSLTREPSVSALMMAQPTVGTPEEKSSLTGAFSVSVLMTVQPTVGTPEEKSSLIGAEFVVGAIADGSVDVDGDVFVEW